MHCMRSVFLAATVISISMAVCAAPTNAQASGAESGAGFTDDFRDIDNLQAMENVAQRRDFPRIVTRPDVRINRTDPTEYRDSTTDRAIGCGWFPSIIRLHNGDLLCFYREGYEHGMADLEARAVVSRSTDGGRTWHPAQVIREEKEWAISPMFATQTKDGNIWLNSRARKVAGEDKGQWKWAELRSTDNGYTWEQVDDKYGLFTGPELSNGELLWTTWGAPKPWQDFRVIIPMRVVDGEIQWGEKRIHSELGRTGDEWSLTETNNPGELVAMMRQQQDTHFYATAKSYDYGKTWTPWRESNVYMGCCPTRPRLHTMPNGWLIFTYGQRWIGRTFAVVSKDNGESWDIPHRQTILHSPQEYHKWWDSHYTDIARAEGDIWIGVDYIMSPRTAEQRGIYGTFIDARCFDDVFKGMMLKQIGSPVGPETVGYWKFDELEGEFARDSVCSNYGEIHGPQRIQGRFGNALDFDGEDDYVMIYDDASVRLPRYFAVEAWVNTRDASKEQTIISKAPAYALALRDGKPVLQIGGGEAIAEINQPLESNRWYHLVATFGARLAYSRAAFCIDGQGVSSPRPPAFSPISSANGEADTEPHIPKSFVEAVAASDWEITGGPMFHEYQKKNESTDNLVIGMDNDLQSRPFDGLIDEVVIHGVDLAPDQIQARYSRYYLDHGSLSSRPIRKPPDAKWTTFTAHTTEAAGTQIHFTIMDVQGKILLSDVASGADLSALNADEIVISAELTSTDPGQTPILHYWSVGTTGEATGGIITKPFPAQSAPLAGEEENPPEEHVIF